MSDLFILFKERVQEDEITKDELTSIEKGFVFDKVSFSYDGVREVVKDISFSIPVGRTTAIVGPSGSGKSTLGKLIFGFYKPSSGQIFIDGQHVGGCDDLVALEKSGQLDRLLQVAC